MKFRLFTWLRQIRFFIIFLLFIVVVIQLPFAFVVRRLVLSTNNIRPLKKKNHFHLSTIKLSRDYLRLDFSILTGEFALERVHFFVELRLHFQTVDLKNINMPRDQRTYNKFRTWRFFNAFSLLLTESGKLRGERARYLRRNARAIAYLSM